MIQIQLAYAIGVAEPVSFAVETFGTDSNPKRDVVARCTQEFDLRPQGIIETLNLFGSVYSAEENLAKSNNQCALISFSPADTFSLGLALYKPLTDSFRAVGEKTADVWSSQMSGKKTKSGVLLGCIGLNLARYLNSFGRNCNNAP